MKRLVVTLVLTCVFSVSASAGIIPTGDAPQPPPPSSSTAPGEIPSGGTAQAADDITDVAISGLLALLGIVI